MTHGRVSFTKQSCAPSVEERVFPHLAIRNEEMGFCPSPPGLKIAARETRQKKGWFETLRENGQKSPPLPPTSLIDRENEVGKEESLCKPSSAPTHGP